MSSHPANPLRLAAVLIPLALLAACGGGGGTPTAAPTVMPGPVTLEPLPDPLIADADMARMHVSGEAPPRLSSAQIEEAINTIVSDANALLYEAVGEADIECSGTSCTYMDSDNTETTVNLEGLSTEELVQTPRYNGQSNAVMTHNGVTTGQRLIAGRSTHNGETENFEFQIYGGWGEDNHFAVQRFTTMAGNDTTTEVNSYSFGKATGTRPTTGTGRWGGTMVGLHTQMNYPVQGSINIRINDFSENRFTILSLFNIKRLDNGADVPNIDWTAVPIEMDGTFASAAGDVRGTFYGDNHEEIGGVFERNNIIGAFGGMRTGQ